jgi:YVTN family beta-propeller protein
MKSINIYSAVYALLIIQSMHGMAPNTITSTVGNPNFSNPASLAINPATGTTAYVANAGATDNRAISIIDVSTNQTMGYVTDLGSPLLANPTFVAIAPNGNYAYAINTNVDTVTVINATTNQVLQNVTPLAGYPFDAPNSLVFSADSTTAYMTNASASYISVIDVASSSETDRIPLDSIPGLTGSGAIALSPDGTQLYVAGIGAFFLLAIDIMTHGVSVITAGSFNAITFDPITAHSKAYASSVFGVSIIDTTNNMLTGSVTGTTPFQIIPAIAFTPDGSTAYFVYATTPQILIVDVTSDTVIGTVTDSLMTLNSARSLALTSDGSTGYIANFANNSVSVMTYVPPTPPPPYVTVLPPASVSGCKTRNRFLLQTDFINNIIWTAPTDGTAPVSYKIYRDAYLTELVETVSANNALQYADHNRNPSIIYSYYITSVDGDGNESDANSVTVTTNC